MPMPCAILLGFVLGIGLCVFLLALSDAGRMSTSRGYRPYGPGTAPPRLVPNQGSSVQPPPSR